MTSAATSKHASGQTSDYGRPSGHGLVFFASAVLGVLGFFNLLDGISAMARSHVFVANAHYVVGSLRVWGLVVLILGVLQLVAAGGVVTGNPLARWFGVAVVALYALCTYDSRENMGARKPA